jgi:general secretion pathway protein A
MERTLETPPSSVFQFFGLRDNPFCISPNPRFLFPTTFTDSASQQLLYGIGTRKGLMLLIGEVGTGKTLLLHRLLDWLSGYQTPVAWIFNSRVNPDDLLDLVLSDFGVACKSGYKSHKLIALRQWLIERHRVGQTAVLIVDEAQGLSVQTLEEIRLLLNLETSREKLIQVVLAGQPELEENLQRHDLRQLRQRIAVWCHTAALNPQETQAYIRKHLRIACADETLFQPEAVALVHAYSRGIPRTINLLCEHSLINACAEDSRIVYPRFVKQAANDCQLDPVDIPHPALHLEGLNPILTGLPLSGPTPQPSSESPAPSVMTEAVPANGQSVILGSTLGLGETANEDNLVAAADLSVPKDDLVLAETTATFPPAVGKPQTSDAEPVPCGSPFHLPDQTNPLDGRSRGGFGQAIASQFHSWWRSFSADARCTWRQFRMRRGRARGGVHYTLASLPRAWCKGFSADVRSTRRRIDQLLRRRRHSARQRIVSAAVKPSDSIPCADGVAECPRRRI